LAKEKSDANGVNPYFIDGKTEAVAFSSYLVAALKNKKSSSEEPLTVLRCVLLLR
jgi:hypothetical protein